MFLFTSLCECRRAGVISPLGSILKSHLEAPGSAIPGSSCLVSLGLSWCSVSLSTCTQLLFHKFPNEGDFSSNTEVLVFPQEYTRQLQIHGFKRLQSQGFQNWNNVFLSKGRCELLPKIFVDLLPFYLFIHQTMYFTLSTANPRGENLQALESHSVTS